MPSELFLLAKNWYLARQRYNDWSPLYKDTKTYMAKLDDLSLAESELTRFMCRHLTDEEIMWSHGG